MAENIYAKNTVRRKGAFNQTLNQIGPYYLHIH